MFTDLTTISIDTLRAGDVFKVERAGRLLTIDAFSAPFKTSTGAWLIKGVDRFHDSLTWVFDDEPTYTDCTCATIAR